jgi:hypothetical protein
MGSGQTRRIDLRHRRDQEGTAKRSVRLQPGDEEDFLAEVDVTSM